MKKSLILIVIIFLSLNFINNIDASGSADISWDYNGQWYSGGFSDYFGWKNFIDFFINTMLDVRIVEKDNKIGLSTKDPLGNEHINTDLVSFDKNTGKIIFAMEFTLPTGKKKYIQYNGSINGDYNISKFFDYNKYLNKSLRDLLYDLVSKNKKIKFDGELSNITLAPDPDFSASNPKINITYEKNIIEENYTSSIPSDAEKNSSSNLSLFSNNSSENISISDIGFFEELNESNSEVTTLVNSSQTQTVVFKIINPQPNKTKISVLVGEYKDFSIDNQDYDSVKWSLNNKLVENGSNSYNFKSLIKGDYSLNVEIKKGSVIKINNWRISVLEKQNNDKKSSNLPVLIIGIILVLIILGVIVFFILRKKNPQTTLS
jgi:hypothetical protein